MAAILEKTTSAKSSEAATNGSQSPHFVNGVQIADGTEIKAGHDFSLWAQDVQDDLLEASLDEYQLHLDQLDASRAHLDGMLSETQATLDALAELSDAFKTVESQTSAFQKQSEGLLADQERSEKLADDIQEKLKYYDFLEPVARRLNAPGAGTLVQGKDFPTMLLRLDECIDYMQTHPEQKESENFRSRYRLLLTRALTLVRGYFVNTLRETAADVSKRIVDQQLNDTTMSALLYAKFRVGAMEMKELGLEIQKRAAPPADADPEQEGEYQSLMNELHTSFATTRGRLILPLIHKKLNDIAQAPSTSKDIVSFARSSISYFRGICLDEFELWGEWFHGQRGVYDFLESLCEPLYDYLRSRIIHENNINRLCQLCILLQTRYLHDPEDETDIPDPNQLDFAILIAPALEDTQTRLLFRTQTILRTEIELFKPKPEDLEYPRHTPAAPGGKATPPTSGRRKPSHMIATPTTPTYRRTSLEPPSSDSESDPSKPNIPLPTNPLKNLPPDIYPTLRTCILLLSRLYRLLHSRVFDDLAHQTVHLTTSSLTTAATLISNKTAAPKTPQPHTTPRQSPLSPQTTSSLFLLTHLLLLKSSLVTFDIDPTSLTPDISFDLPTLLSALRSANPATITRTLVSGSLVVTNMLDAKAELDARLRDAINKVIEDWAGRMVAPIEEGANESGAKGHVRGKASVGSGQSQLSPKEAANRTAALRALVEAQVPVLRAALDAFMHQDERTKRTLLVAVMERVVGGYEAFVEGLAAGGKGRGAAGGFGSGGGVGAGMGRKGKGREEDVWDLGTFEEWIGGVFGVGQSGEEEDGDEDEDEDGSERGGDDDEGSDVASV
ncbi:MAG: hypothetical protein Q9160_000226 [Pyrenula sp. 1 TL-2023]